VNARCRNATIAGGLLLSCSLVFGGWTQLDPGIAGAEYTGVYFLHGNTQVGYAVGAEPDSLGGEPGLIIKTTDGGNTWEQQYSPAASRLRAVYFTDVDTGYACGDFGAALKTANGGASWTEMTVGGTATLTYVSFPSNSQRGYIGAYPRSSAVNVLKTTDGGSTWVSFSLGGAMDWSTGCAVANDSTGIVFGLGAFIYGWPAGQYQDPQAPDCDILAASYSESDNNRAYLVGNDTALGIGIVRYTATGGYPKWDSVTCPAIPLYCVDYASPETAYVGGAHGLIGRTYSTYEIRATDDPGVSTAITGICFPNGPDTGYATSGPYILKTTDAGGVAEERAPVAVRTGVTIGSNPCRRGVTLCSDENVLVTVFDAAGRAVLRQTASMGRSFLPLHAGAYFVRAGVRTARVVVTD